MLSVAYASVAKNPLCCVITLSVVMLSVAAPNRHVSWAFVW